MENDLISHVNAQYDCMKSRFSCSTVIPMTGLPGQAFGGHLGSDLANIQSPPTATKSFNTLAREQHGTGS
ncbi:uncharacterized protein N7487_000271 [Penicillium crustosum]|uniref:uncharacterized protein n=1 Tax=Penicillium crustosum TaxID=36656 RepID=UPI0023941545|nr:uncharacterized protein N7487_000271 [Penicillium crustosum]KAJ5416721.1 hypothetical protein N7487_000271 [Penicillium crustosum]